MQKIFVVFIAFIAAGCASKPDAPFDPAGDVRIGTEVDTACYGGAGFSRTGGYIKIGDHPGFLVGDSRHRFLLIFSRGCGDLGGGGAIPVFTHYGDNCRRRGEQVSTARGDFRISGGCMVQHIYEWDEDAAEPQADEDLKTPVDEESAAPEPDTDIEQVSDN